MDRNLRHNLEKVFRESNSNDAIFDAFQILILYKIKDSKLFEILLANPILSPDEIIMYSNKLAETFKLCSYDIYMWTAEILTTKFNCSDSAFVFYIKAANIKPFKFEPFVAILKLYDYEMPRTINQMIIEFVLESIDFVTLRSKVFDYLTKHYNKINEPELAFKFTELREKALQEELENEN